MNAASEYGRLDLIGRFACSLMLFLVVEIFMFSDGKLFALNDNNYVTHKLNDAEKLNTFVFTVCAIRNRAKLQCWIADLGSDFGSAGVICLFKVGGEVSSSD